jgi:2-C-methyl-D-erythritol 4-phosphate cytidylyltransferase
VFRRDALQHALHDASAELLAQATDDAWLVELAGGVVRLIESSSQNIKVTTSFDLRLAEMLLSR